MKSVINKKLVILPIVLLLSLAILPLGTVMANSAKHLQDGKTTNNGFTNVVGDNVDGGITGWVSYLNQSKTLKTTWVIDGLEPNTEYQLKLQSNTGNEDILVCDEPNTGAIWQCGNWGTVTFLVLATVTSNVNGQIGTGITNDLPTGYYTEMQFLITQNTSPWGSAWTEENPTGSVFTIV